MNVSASGAHASIKSDKGTGLGKTARNRCALRVAALALASACAVCAQDAEQVRRREGPQIYSASVFGAYYSEGLGRGLGLTGLGDTLHANSAVGGTANMGWARIRPSSSFALTYVPGFVMAARRPEWHSFQHALSATMGKALSGRWQLTAGVSAALDSTAQFLFMPTVFGQIAAAPATFDDLVQGMLRNSYTNFELASLLTGAAPVQSPARSLIFGDRMLTAALRMGLAYSISPRTSLNFSATGSRYQYLTANRDVLHSNLLQQATMGGVGIGISHSWSPRTQIGASVSAGRSFSRYQDAYQLVTDIQFGHTLSPRWLVQLHGGSGFMEGLRVENRLPSGPQYQGGGSLTFKTRAHTFLGAADRMFGDAYGMGSASTLVFRGAWNWAHPGGDWIADAGFAEQYYHRTAFGTIDGWHATASFGRRVSQNTSVHLQYMRLSYGGPAGTTRTDQSAVRVIFAWSASPVRALSRQE